MAGGLRSLRWRAAIMFAGTVFVILWVVASGRTAYVVQVDFSWAREVLEGAIVEIDGDSVGTLQRYGRGQFVTGFEVEPGEHVIRLLVDDCESVPEDFEVGPDGSRLSVLMADYEDGYNCRVLLR